MTYLLDLPDVLTTEFADEAVREGLSPSDHAALLLYIITALQAPSDGSTPFRHAIKVFSRCSID